MNIERLRVMVLADSRSFHTERYVAELGRQGCEVLTASLEEGSMPHHVLRRRGPFRALHYALAAVEVRKLIRSFAPHLLNPHFASGYGFVTALAERRGALPILLHLWGSDILIVPRKSIFHRRKTCLALESADCVIGDSDYLVDQAARIGELRRRQTIAWGIEREALRYRCERATLSVPLKIIVPRIHQPIYNNLFVVRALADLVNNGRVALTFPDFGGMVADFRAEASRLTPAGLTFYPKLPRDEYLRFAATHDVYVSAALSDSSPVSMLEAMGLGLIPIAGDIPGVREWLTPESGFRFDLQHEESLAAVVTGLLEGKPDLVAMRRANLAQVERKAIFEDNVAETMAIMRELVAERAS